MKATLRFDGGARPKNPGHAGFAAVVQIGDKKYPISRYIGIKTNNEAEYYGLVVGIKYAIFLGATELDIISDSELVVKQVNKEWSVKEPRLKPLRADARELLDEHFEYLWEIRWEKRDKNGEADFACTNAIFYGMAQNKMLPSSIRKKLSSGEQLGPFRTSSSKRTQLSKIMNHREISNLIHDLRI